MATKFGVTICVWSKKSLTILDAAQNPINAFIARRPGSIGTKMFDKAGFERDSYWGIYHARQDCPQMAGGYNKIYDDVFGAFTRMEPAKFDFSSGDKNYTIWAWKGDYLNMGAGAEMGIYEESGITDHWSANPDNAMQMQMVLRYTKGNIKNDINNIVAVYTPAEPQWWITSFNPKYQNVQADDLTALFNVTFNTQEMYTDFYNKYGNEESEYYDPRWDFDEKSNTAQFVF